MAQQNKTVSAKTLTEYENILSKLSAGTQQTLRNALMQVDFSNRSIAIQQIEQIVVSLTGVSTEVASLIGANFYDEVSLEVTGKSGDAQALNTYSPKSDFVTVNALMHSVNDEDDEIKFINEMLERVDMQIRKAANNSVVENGYRDKRRPRFARVPTYEKGSPPCLFCLMLASRGAVNYSRSSAGETTLGHNRYHNNCKCKIVPVFKSMDIEGYDPDALYDEWQKGYTKLAKKRAKRKGTSVEDEIKRYKRKQQEASEKAYQKRKNFKRKPN